MVIFGLYVTVMPYSGGCMTILLTKTTAARNGVALCYRNVRGLYFLAVVFVTNIFCLFY